MWVVRRTRRKLRGALTRRLGPDRFRRALHEAPTKRLVIGASWKFDPGWIPTEQSFLDLTRPEQWAEFMAPDTIDAMLAEHVWEHLTPADGLTGARTCYRYLKPGGYLRLAVPDGYNPDPVYHGWVKVGGEGQGQRGNDHKVLYTYRTITDLLEQAGFTVRLYEYFSEAGEFQYTEWDRAQGTIRRSLRYDPRNKHGLVFTSIVLDAVKP
jgi:predicted SAM-dependent methyltransferase